MSTTAIGISPERDAQLCAEAKAAGMDVPPRRHNSEAAGQAMPIEAETIFVHIPAQPDELTAQEQLLIKCTFALGFGRDGAAVNRVVDTLRGHEEAVTGGDAGQRLHAVRSRQRKTAEQLAAAKSSAEQLEAAHFESLATGSDAEIESARNAVLAIQGRLNLIECELESLKSIEISARAALGNAVENELPKAFDALVQQAVTMREPALAAIKKAMDSGLLAHFRALGLSTEILSLIGNDPQGLRARCSAHAWSRPFGRLRPINHVSFSAPEYQHLDPETIRGLRVQID